VGSFGVRLKIVCVRVNECEKESLIELNKQRVKTASQIYNESTALRDIYSERARRREKG
jgi:hypothetical protein